MKSKVLLENVVENTPKSLLLIDKSRIPGVFQTARAFAAWLQFQAIKGIQ
ncbi:hypothetical protein YERSI8AC_10256 [Enterobacterales bacterium 8AC]|jgi:hypothetical protein|nr:hypothetical protein YERSI8AC_10256 [Enterobacterales bacterium 8AC]